MRFVVATALVLVAAAARASEPLRPAQDGRELQAQEARALPVLRQARDAQKPSAQAALAEGAAELADLRAREERAGLLGGPRETPRPPANTGSPLRAEMLDALGDSVDGLPVAPFSSAPGVAASLPELAGIDSATLKAKFDIPVELNPDVIAYIRFFQTDARDHFGRWLARSTRYLPMMRDELARAGVPLDTVYLSMIESGFSAFALSWVRAAGLWQFMVPTGRAMGLRCDFWVDERRDPLKSTVAAAKYLKQLHAQFGDWYLAWAGYNAGGGKVSRAITHARSEDFWRLSQGRVLRPETKGYVPKLIAAALISRHPERFGFTDIAYEPPLDYDEVTVPAATDVGVIAKAAGVEVEAVQNLNPELRRSCTPPGAWKVKLPKGAAARFAEAFAQVPAGERLAEARHVVDRGDSLSRLAKAYGVTEAIITRANRLSPRQSRLPGGMTLTIPLAQSRGLAANLPEVKAPRRSRWSAARVAKSSAHAGPGQYVVHDGDTLWGIAQRFKVSVDDLKRKNGLEGRRAKSLRIGDVIDVRG